MSHNFLSRFIPSDIQASITHLQNTLTKITSWMTYKLLSLNFSKAEFLLIGLKRQLATIHSSSPSIDTTQFAGNLGFMFDEHISFSVSLQAWLYCGLSKYQINRLQHIQNALARTVVQDIKYQHITSVMKSLHWLKVSERIEYNASSWSQHTLFTLRHSDQTIVITQSRSSLLPTCFTSSLEPAS